jgi:hypothetical protein
MSKVWFPVLILSVMLLISILFYADMLGQAALNNGLFACTLLWFGGLLVADFWKRKG